MCKKYIDLFIYQSFDEFLKDWHDWNKEYDEVFEIFISEDNISQELKTKAAVLYEKIRRLNRYGLIVFKNEMMLNEIYKKLRL